MINTVKTSADVAGYKFLTNQSDLLHVQSANEVIYHGVNVIVDRPKKGDILCVTLYKNSDGSLKDAADQKMVWIDGLSVVPSELSEELDAIGICYAVHGNFAYVRYRQETIARWSVGERWQVTDNSSMNDNVAHEATVTLNGTAVDTKFAWQCSSRKEFVQALNTFLVANGAGIYSAELVEVNTDKPAVDDTDAQPSGSYLNRVVVNAKFTEWDWKPVTISGFTLERQIGIAIPANGYYYINNGYTRTYEGGCCRAKYYDYIQGNQTAPTGPVVNVNQIPGGILSGNAPARKTDFDSNDNCAFLRGVYANYDEYLESHMVKWPTGGVGSVGLQPSGKEYTYRLAECTYLDNSDGTAKPLYIPAYTAANISVNCHGLGKGSWWLPSSAEMCELMRDVTRGTSAWGSNPDIINQVLIKMSTYGGWSELSASTYRWTASRYSQYHAYDCYGYYGGLGSSNFCDSYSIAPITLIDLTA